MHRQHIIQLSIDLVLKMGFILIIQVKIQFIQQHWVIRIIIDFHPRIFKALPKLLQLEFIMKPEEKVIVRWQIDKQLVLSLKFLFKLEANQFLIYIILVKFVKVLQYPFLFSYRSRILILFLFPPSSVNQKLFKYIEFDSLQHIEIVLVVFKIQN